MTNYVPSIPDCDRWKRYVSNIAKSRSDSKLNSYVKSESPLGDIKVVSPSEGDLAIVKSRVKQYKQKTRQVKSHTTPKGGRGKTSKGKGAKTQQKKGKAKNSKGKTKQKKKN
jgi:hypothetical protein